MQINCISPSHSFHYFRDISGPERFVNTGNSSRTGWSSRKRHTGDNINNYVAGLAEYSSITSAVCCDCCVGLGMANKNDEETLLELAKSKPEGISGKDISAHISHLEMSQIALIINSCLKSGSLELFKVKGELLYKHKDPSKKSAGGDVEEKLVYSIIQQSGNKGIWIRDIRFKSNLNLTQLNKVLKSLETKKLIKAVKSVAASKKKVYMLYELEPDSSVTGGAWYQDQDFESEFVDILNQQCYRYLLEKSEEAKNMGGGPLLVRNKSYATASDVHKFIIDLRISKINLSVEDIDSILYTVVLDGNAERISSPDGSYRYRMMKKHFPAPGISRTMCGVCPLIRRCDSNDPVNPKNCSYLTDWLCK